MKQDLMIEVMQKMTLNLDNFQMKQLQSTLESVLCNYEIRTAATGSLEKGKTDYQEELSFWRLNALRDVQRKR